jgi:hypothetical protein
MDPRQRLLLHVAQEALSDAAAALTAGREGTAGAGGGGGGGGGGVAVVDSRGPVGSLRAATAVAVGIASAEYSQLGLQVSERCVLHVCVYLCSCVST